MFDIFVKTNTQGVLFNIFVKINISSTIVFLIYKNGFFYKNNFRI